ncbi:uncharacterized protein LOC133533417 isoform X1 [Cydia pomonella]|uniref:uncharacterized protein LOC133533417 isoform X1 n=1 Tax=Cydia pomonella TaxID=82600 RepID=UPI002ADD7107|nr:uncharacterized protein LOC133533417 isoform X1 [Cydia pomonella]
MLKVLPVTLSGPNGSYETFAFLDDGSTATMIDCKVAARLGLIGPEEFITVNGIMGLQKTTKVRYVDFYIRGKYESDIHLVNHAKAVQSLGLNEQTLSRETIESYAHLKDLAEYLTYADATPTVLIGAEHWHLSICREVCEGRRNEPAACRTLLGWTLYGPTSSKTKPVEFVNHCQLDRTEPSENERLESLIKEQYKLDSLGISKRETLFSKLDSRAVEILDATTTRLPTGRYEVGLPWRDNIQCVPDSCPQALSRFLSLERRMIREPAFADAYKKFIDNMIAKNYAEECDSGTYYNHLITKSVNTSIDLKHDTNLGDYSNKIHTLSDNLQPSTVSPNKTETNFDIELSSVNNNKNKLKTESEPNKSDINARIRWYLPHFGVYHPQKRKLRVVHDAAATNQGVSLNSLLLQGPDLLENLLGILFRFREGAVAITADIKEMFPQIKIREQDRDALRFLWRDVQSRETMPLKEYRMTAVIFGASSSPFTALYIKHKNAMSHQDSYPAAANASIHSSYMDDFLDSLDDVDEAAQMASDVVTIHRNACFEMCGWNSNDQGALRLVPTELRAVQPSEMSLGSESSSVRALGVSWDPISDTVGFRTGLEGLILQGSFNKRKVLFHLMKVYDPLGLLGPIVVKGRILLQEAWRSNIDWDTPFPPSQILKWNEWFKELSDVSTIRIPRWYAKLNGEPLHRELHIFADASELAFATVAYWRLLYADGTVKLALITSKTRVSPLKPISIPRLELQGALIASRLAVTIKEFHKKKPLRTFLWTDSRTVLGWLRSDARTYKPFVAHRVGEITENTRVQDWKWVPTDLNVADDATRIKPLHLNPNHRWFTGPSFLLDPPENWPVEPAGQPIVQEERKQTSGLVVGHLTITADFSRFSDWLRLLRATARVLQAASKFRSALDRVGRVAPSTDVRLRQRTNRPTSTTLIPLTAELMEAAERHVLKKVQSESFSDEIPIIERGELIPKSSRLAKLSPRMGPDNLLHLAGRIVAVQDVGSEIKFPIILDGRHPVVRLLVNFYHRKAGHANNEMVVNEVRQKYWLLHLRSTVRSVTSKCLSCRIKRAKPMNPMTGNLPPQRLAHHRRPFTYTGLDYFGPINTKIGRRQEKRYVALYTCMTSRAVHLELVHSLSADSAIMSLRRFIARRGAPNTVYSDNGTCFVGADRILREFYQNEVYDFAANRGIKWSFIPAAAPFFGGCWERLIRTVKVALNATLREREPNPEVLVTLLLEAEAIVNSRPLTHVPIGPEDQETLTPFHFLIGSSSNQVLPATLDDRDLLRRADWRKALRLADHFWNRWVKEILPTMQPRQIAENREHDLTLGDLVIIVDQNLPRGTWPRGRVVATFPGRDGVVRVVDVATSGGILRRPSKKLVRLEA